MNIEQIENFNKRSFPYQLLLRGKNIHLRKMLLDELVETANSPKDNINLWNTPAETIFIIKNSFLTSLFFKNGTLYINEHDD